MKLLLTSIDAIIDKTKGIYFDGIKDALESFQNKGDDYQVVILSIHQEELDKIPNDFYKFHLGNYSLRKSNRLIDKIKEQTKIDYNDFYILGSKDADMILAANSKVLLLTADYAKGNNPDDRIYTEGYGIGILSPDRLTNFFDNFLGLDKPWYYSLDVSPKTKLYGLTDAMTLKQTNEDVKDICKKLKDFLKNSNRIYKNPFLIYALVSVYQIFKEVEDIKYWGYYPSSSTEPNEILYDFKEVLRKSFNSSRTKKNILVRTKNSPQRKKMGERARVDDGCNSQLDSIKLDPWFKYKIKGESICIIDDFTNHGSSCETTRLLLEKAGAKKIIFITLGKFRYDYKKFDYTIDGDIYEKDGIRYTKNNSYTTLRGTINYSSSGELLNSLKTLVS